MREISKSICEQVAGGSFDLEMSPSGTPPPSESTSDSRCGARGSAPNGACDDKVGIRG